MTDTTMPKPPLGVGNLISETYRIFFRNILTFVSIVFGPVLLLGLAGLAFVGAMNPAFTGGAVAPELGAGFIVLGIAGFVVFFVINAMITLATFDLKLGKKARPLSYIGGGLRSILPIILVTLVLVIGFFALGAVTIGPAAAFESGALLAIAGIAFMILTIYIFVRLCVFVPAIVVERLGFSSLRRSNWLTSGYFWPIVGAYIVNMLLLFLLQIGVGMVLALVFGLGIAGFAPDGGGAAVATFGVLGVLGVIVNSVMYSFFYALPAIFITLVYARLREIKEGMGMEDLTTVFE